MKAKMSTARQKLIAPVPRTRSRVTNGRSMFVGKDDARSALARRFRDLCLLHAEDLGGPENLSQAQQQLIRRIASLEVQLEVLEGRMVDGDTTVDVESFARISSHLRRLLESLGLDRKPRERPATLADIVAKHAAKKLIEKPAESPASAEAAIIVAPAPLQLTSEPPSHAEEPA